jgi:hypothetical protein
VGERPNQLVSSEYSDAGRSRRQSDRGRSITWFLTTSPLRVKRGKDAVGVGGRVGAEVSRVVDEADERRRQNVDRPADAGVSKYGWRTSVCATAGVSVIPGRLTGSNR